MDLQAIAALLKNIDIFPKYSGEGDIIKWIEKFELKTQLFGAALAAPELQNNRIDDDNFDAAFGDAAFKDVVFGDAALGVCLEIDENIVEDALRLRKKNDHLHINVAELEVILRGINLAARWA